MTLPVAILAGGFAMRLFPLTQTIPKSLVEVAGKPFIEWQLAYLKQQGIQRVILCVGHLGEQIQAYLGTGERYGLELLFSSDGSSPQGTGGALKKALPLLGDVFFVLYGDTYLSASFPTIENRFYRQKHPLLMTLYKNASRWDTSNVLFENGRLLSYNKKAPSANMSHIDYGLSVLSASSVSDYPVDGPFDLADFFHHYSLEEKILGHEVFSRFYEIGTLEGLKETSRFLLRRDFSNGVTNNGLYKATSE